MEIKKYPPVIIGGAILIFGGLIFLGYQSQKAVKEVTKNETITPITEETKAIKEQPTIGPTTKALQPTQSTEKVGTLTLTVSQPGNGTTTNSSSVVVKGKTLPKAEVFVNDQETIADSAGSFSVKLNLDEGENYILVAAADSEGNSVEQELTVTYESK